MPKRGPRIRQRVTHMYNALQTFCLAVQREGPMPSPRHTASRVRQPQALQPVGSPTRRRSPTLQRPLPPGPRIRAYRGGRGAPSRTRTIRRRASHSSRRPGASFTSAPVSVADCPQPRRDLRVFGGIVRWEDVDGRPPAPPTHNSLAPQVTAVAAADATAPNAQSGLKRKAAAAAGDKGAAGPVKKRPKKPLQRRPSE